MRGSRNTGRRNPPNPNRREFCINPLAIRLDNLASVRQGAP
jgi:hypothetical protein